MNAHGHASGGAHRPETHSKLIRVILYQPRWASDFRGAAEQLRGTLGDLALRIDHIGSTAVPGLSAKPVIDIQVTVQTLDQIARRSGLLTAIGLEHRANITEDRPRNGIPAAPRNEKSNTSGRLQRSLPVCTCMFARLVAGISAILW